MNGRRTRYTTHICVFRAEPAKRKRGDPPKPPTAFALAATNLNTDLAEPVKTRALSLREGERTAVILLSDGQHNAGEREYQVYEQ